MTTGPGGPVGSMRPMGTVVKWGVSPWQRGLWGLWGEGGRREVGFLAMEMEPVGPMGGGEMGSVSMATGPRVWPGDRGLLGL